LDRLSLSQLSEERVIQSVCGTEDVEIETNKCMNQWMDIWICMYVYIYRHSGFLLTPPLLFQLRLLLRESPLSMFSRYEKIFRMLSEICKMCSSVHGILSSFCIRKAGFKIRWSITNVGEGVENWNAHTLLVGM
jgi:hypothetical protein